MMVVPLGEVACRLPPVRNATSVGDEVDGLEPEVAVRGGFWPCGAGDAGACMVGVVRGA